MAKPMNLLDLAILVVIALGILIGWRNGLIGPLLAGTTFLIGYWVVSTHPGLIALVPSALPRPYAILVLPAAVGLLVGIGGRMVLQSLFRLPLTRQLDKGLGAVANGGLAFVIAYVVLLGLVGAGTVLDPIAQVSSVRSSQVTAMRLLLAQNPAAAAMVPPSEITKLAGAASSRALPIEQLGQYARVIDYYERTLRPQLSDSELAPIVLQLGSRLPFIGRVAHLPTKTILQRVP
jgi:uncharacterized membrane protein required for colicin V production